MALLKVNFFSTSGAFLAHSRKLEDELATLGTVVHASRSGGTAQFIFETELDTERIRHEVLALRLGGSVTVNRFDDEGGNDAVLQRTA